MTNEPVPRPSTTFFAFSWAKHFFFSTSWKYRRVPIWLKTLNPKRYAAKYRYRKGLDVYALAKRKWAKRKKQKPFPHKMNATVLILVCYKIQIQIFSCQISPGLTEPVDRVASTTACNTSKIFLQVFLWCNMSSALKYVLSRLLGWFKVNKITSRPSQ